MVKISRGNRRKGEKQVLRHILNVLFQSEQINGMSTKQINSIIQQFGFEPSTSLVQQVGSYLPQQSQEHLPKSFPLYIRAIITLMCESKTSKNFSQLTEFLPHNTLQNTIRQLQQEQKSSFVLAITQSLNNFPHSLFIHNKVSQLNTSFWTYHRYCEICQILAHYTDYSCSLLKVIEAYGWVIYLYLKTQLKKSFSFLFCSGLLVAVLGRLWGKYLAGLPEATVWEIAGKKLPGSTKNFELYLPHVDNTFRQNLEKKFGGSSSDLKRLLEKEQKGYELLCSMMEDLKAGYRNSVEYIFDQTCFINQKQLEVNEKGQKKNLPHYNDEKDHSLTSLPTPTKIPLSALEDFDFMEKINKPSNNEGSRVPRLAWIQNCIQRIPTKFSFQQVYKKYNKSIKYQDFIEREKNNLNKVLMEFNPSCRNITKRQENMEKLFVFFMQKLVQMYENQLSVVLEDDKLMRAILCLVSNICSFCYGTGKVRYLEYMKIFSLNFYDAFMPINWFGRYMQLPETISDHLYQLERNILLQDLFTTDLGRHILSNTDSQLPMIQMAICKRFHHHLRCRVMEVSKELSIPEEFGIKIYNLILSLVKKSDSLLGQLPVEKVIAYSILACLSLNKIQNVSVRKVVKWACSEKETVNQIISFYNDQFLELIQPLVKEFPFEINFLLTPIQQQYKQKLFSGHNFTPLKQNHTILINKPQYPLNSQEKQESKPSFVTEYQKKSSSIDDNMQIQVSESSLIQEDEKELIKKHQFPRKKVKRHHEYA